MTKVKAKKKKEPSVIERDQTMSSMSDQSPLVVKLNEKIYKDNVNQVHGAIKHKHCARQH